MTFTTARNTEPARVGVGLLYQKEVHSFLVEHLEMLDYLEIVPDTAWTDHGENMSPRYVDNWELLQFFQQLRPKMPIVAHSIGLSIGSTHRFHEEHVDQICHWDRMLNFPWHSDHLWFTAVADSAGEEYLGGVAFPVVFDRAVLDMLVDRVQIVLSKINKPYLLENNVSFIEYVDQELDEPTFFNELCARSGCGILLDLHNVYVNWRNNATDMETYLAALDLSRVVEIHLAGGFTHDGFYLDAHSGSVPDELWDVAAATVKSCPNLRGITFELLGSWYPKMGEGALEETLMRMRDLAEPAR